MRPVLDRARTLPEADRSSGWTTVALWLLKLGQLNTGWCTPGVHPPDETGANRRQPDTAFTLRTAVRA
jgi:hypothetical protein